MLDALSPARRRVVWTALGVLVAAVIAAVAAALLRGGVTPVAQGRPGPVVLVSGYGGSVRALGPLEQALRADGRDVVVMAPLDGGTGDIEAQAQALDATVRDALESSGAGSVDVVGYSAGGVVARAWVRDHGGAGQARRVLSIGSPQHGTTVAAAALETLGGCPDACRQLAPDSDFLRSLNAGDETPAGPVFVSVWSTSDEVVRPPDSARLEGGLNVEVQSACPGARTPHDGLPSDPVVLAVLVTALGDGPPAAPTRVACG